MNGKPELEYLAMVVQDFINTLPRSAQIAMAERAQMCVSSIERILVVASGDSKSANGPE